MSLDFYVDGEHAANVTHNLNQMAREADLYKLLWYPEVLGYGRAWQIIEPLEKGITLLKSDPERFKVFEAKNGWGTYKWLLEFCEEVLEACKKSPQGRIEVSR